MNLIRIIQHVCKNNIKKKFSFLQLYIIIIIHILFQKMGLDYLMKKVWHTGSMKNIEKVWQAEQKQREIDRKHLEMKKKLQQQRHNQQLKRLQVQAGLIPKSHLDRMEWMYEWGTKIQHEKNAEDFLTGKTTEPGKRHREIKHVFKQQITNQKCQDFALIHEDPMFLIMQQQKKAKEAITQNPVKMKEIYDSIEYKPQTAKKNSEKKQERSQKEVKKQKKQKKEKKQKKQKKDKKSKKHRSSRSSSSSSSSRSKSRSRDKKKQKKQQSQLHKEYLRQHFGPIVKEEDGYLKPDFGKFKRKYKTQYQLNEEERRNALQKMMSNGKKYYDEKMLNTCQQNDNKHPREAHDEISKMRLKQMENTLQDNIHRSHRRYE